MSTVVVVYSDDERREMYFAYQDYVLMAFAAAGATVVEEKDFLRNPAVPADAQLVCFFVKDRLSESIFATVEPHRRWSYAIDERALGDGRAYTHRRGFLSRHNANKMVITFQNLDHLQQLKAARIQHVTMPCCVPGRRPRTEKPHGVFAVGAFDPAAYPIRFKVRRLLLEVDGYSNRVVHQYIEPATREKYYDILDRYQLGITCRADYRDRMVQKYVEFGMCHVLPVGDCPTYMPADMKKLIVNVDNRSDKWIVDEVKRLLATPDELHARQEAYSELVHQRYDLLTNANRVIKEISDWKTR